MKTTLTPEEEKRGIRLFCHRKNVRGVRVKFHIETPFHWHCDKPMLLISFIFKNKKGFEYQHPERQFMCAHPNCNLIFREAYYSSNQCFTQPPINSRLFHWDFFESMRNILVELITVPSGPM